MSIRERAKKHSVALTLCGMLTAGFGSYNTFVKYQEEKHHYDFEIFFSNYQDKIDCKLQKLDSLSQIKKCNP